MKGLDNILKPLGDRINSPLYSTYLIAWCISNWKVFYITFFISADQLSGSKIQYIQHHFHHWCYAFIVPLIATAIYLFILPLLEKEVLKYWYKNKADRKEIVVNKMEKSPVSGEEYRELQIKYINRETELTAFFKRERSWLNEKETLMNKINKQLEELSEKESQVAGMTATIQQYQANYDVGKIFPGRWKLTYRNIQNQTDWGEEHFYITPQSNSYQLENEPKEKFRIRYFYFDSNRNNVYLLKENTDSENPEFFFNDLRKVDDDTYEGTEFGIRKDRNSTKPVYMSFSVTYRRSGAQQPFFQKQTIDVGKEGEIDLGANV